jgi:hypothetical protein
MDADDSKVGIDLPDDDARLVIEFDLVDDLLVCVRRREDLHGERGGTIENF